MKTHKRYVFNKVTGVRISINVFSRRCFYAGNSYLVRCLQQDVSVPYDHIPDHSFVRLKKDLKINWKCIMWDYEPYEV